MWLIKTQPKELRLRLELAFEKSYRITTPKEIIRIPACAPMNPRQVGAPIRLTSLRDLHFAPTGWDHCFAVKVHGVVVECGLTHPALRAIPSLEGNKLLFNQHHFLNTRKIA